MNVARKLILISASLPLLAPAVGAANEAAAFDACVDAFVSANLPKEQKVHLKKLDTTRSPVSIHGRAYKISLSAKGVESGKQLATATCVVERDGTVIALNGKAIAPGLSDSKVTLTSR